MSIKMSTLTFCWFLSKTAYVVRSILQEIYEIRLGFSKLIIDVALIATLQLSSIIQIITTYFVISLRINGIFMKH